MSIGGCSFTLMDNDQRYVDNVSGSLLFQQYNEFNRLSISSVAGSFIVGNNVDGDTSLAAGRIAAVGSNFLDVFVISGEFENAEGLAGVGGGTATLDSFTVFPFRYHFKYCMVEIGFDISGKKHNDNFWFPIFKGQITNKRENENQRLVIFNLKDESKVIFDEELAPIRRATDVISYDATQTDDRQVQMGLYYGKHDFLAKNAKNRNDQIMIAVIQNQEGAAESRGPKLLLTPQATNILQITNDIVFDEFDDDSTKDRIYFWLWNTNWAGITEKQWAYLNMQSPNLNITDPIVVLPNTGSIEIKMTGILTSADDLEFFLVDGVTKVTISLDEYYDLPTAQDEIESHDPFVKITAKLIADNLATILFQTLIHQVGIKEREFDAKLRPTTNAKTLIAAKVIDEDDTVAFFDGDITGESDQINFFSWNDAFYYINSYALKTGVHIETSTRAIQLIDKMIEFIRGAFFVGQGTQKDSISPLPEEDWTDLVDLDNHNTRRIKLVINQARPVFDGITELSESKIRNVNMERAVSDVVNSCTVQNFDFNTASSDFKSIESFESTSENSISVYGRKTLEIKSEPGKLAFIYDSIAYAQFLSSHFILIFKDPPVKVTFDTNLIGMSYRDGLPEFDLKRLVYIREELFTGIPGDDNTRGLYEIHAKNFNTASYAFSFTLFWAGYLLAPDGDIENKKWAFADDPNSYANDGTDRFTYHEC